MIQRNSMDYLAPIAGDFTATATIGAETNWDGFLRMLSRKGIARVTVGAELEYEGAVAGRLTGEFVAFGKDRL